MKLNEMRNKEVKRAMPFGKNEVTFDHIEYRIDEEENITGAWVHIKEYKPLFVPIFEEENYQLDLLTEQLGVESENSHDDREINKYTGKTIIAHKYTRYDENRDTDFTNISFNPRYNADSSSAPTLA